MNFPEKNKLYVFDGAMGTMLQKYGFKPGQAPEEWNLTEEETVFKIHRTYVEAGSDIIQSNTFGGNLLRLKHYGLEAKLYELNKKGVDIARKAGGNDIIIAASMGPCGGILEPFGELSREEVLESFCLQARAFDEADFINIETMQSLEEALIAMEAVRTELKEKKICVSLTYQSSPTGYHTMYGDEPEKIIEVLEKNNIDIIGSNCGEGYEQFVELMEKLPELTSSPLMAKPNAGIPKVEGGKIIYPETPEDIEHKVTSLFALGVQIVGGCCGTTPEHIKTIKKVRDKIF